MNSSIDQRSSFTQRTEYGTEIFHVFIRFYLIFTYFSESGQGASNNANTTRTSIQRQNNFNDPGSSSNRHYGIGKKIQITFRFLHFLLDKTYNY